MDMGSGPEIASQGSAAAVTIGSTVGTFVDGHPPLVDDRWLD